MFPDLKILELDPGTMNSVWVPDLFIPSEKRALVHQVTIPNKLMHISPNGKIQYSLRYIMLHYTSVVYSGMHLFLTTDSWKTMIWTLKIRTDYLYNWKIGSIVSFEMSVVFLLILFALFYSFLLYRISEIKRSPHKSVCFKAVHGRQSLSR